jgi:alpha-ribazole phosphatase
LREFDFGEWEGLTWAQIVERWPELADRSYADAKLYHPEGGESFDDVVARAASFLHDVSERADPQVLIVTHAGVLHAMIEAFGPSLQGRGTAPIVFATASITRIAMEPEGARLISLNDVDHLNPGS